MARQAPTIRVDVQFESKEGASGLESWRRATEILLRARDRKRKKMRIMPPIDPMMTR